MSEDEPAGRPDSALRRSRRFIDEAYRQADALLDRGQNRAFRLLWLFLPAPAIATQFRFQALAVSRFLSDAGQQSLAYGALIAVARGGGSTFDAALIGVASLLPPAIFGLYGGAVADALPKRVALAGVYNLQALLCFAAPGLFGTSLAAMMLLLFAVNSLGQISGPTESSVLPLVADDAQLATATALISFASTLGTSFGTALLAPVLVRVVGVDAVIYTAGVLLLLAASRVFDLAHDTQEAGERLHPRLLRRKIGARETVAWFLSQPAVATMVFVAVLAGTAQIVVQTLAPRYVQTVLDIDAADAVYVFAPGALGLLLALFLSPRLIRSRGERTTALTGFVIATVTLSLLGNVERLGPLDSVNPIRLLSLAGIEMAPKLRLASLLAMPLGLGIALSTTSVQTYINRRVPLSHQGRTFALQSTIKNGTAIVPLVCLGAAANTFGVATVLVGAPFVLLAMAVALIQLSRHFGGHAPRGGLDVLASYWEEGPEPAR